MSEQMEVSMADAMSFKDSHADTKHGLRGHVSVYRRNKLTGEVSLWDENDNIIPISGYQWILMKMFGLHLDASHARAEVLDRDTNLVIPELNQDGMLRIGTDPNEYTVMQEDISAKHIVQGFIVGNGGAGEDQMTAKNTDYSFINLRNPIPFRQATESSPIDPSIIHKYCGKYRISSTVSSYFIKRFESLPHIYHGWWKDSQRWDYVDPVSQSDLGPNAQNGSPKTSRIETYVDCNLKLDEDDCLEYFANNGNTQTPAINELGLVAFDSTGNGTRSMLYDLYDTKIVPALNTIFNDESTDDDVRYFSEELIPAIHSVLHEQLIMNIENTQLESFRNTIDDIYQAIQDSSPLDWTAYQEDLESDNNIRVVAHYTSHQKYLMEEDSYRDMLTDPAFDDTTVDEAQRIKLITYYTFKSIPLQTNWEIIINYRIYAN